MFFGNSYGIFPGSKEVHFNCFYLPRHLHVVYNQMSVGTLGPPEHLPCILDPYPLTR